MAVGRIFKNRKLWMVTIIVFFLLLMFFDRNNVLERQRLKEEIQELETQRDYYINKITEDSTVIERLKEDDYLEQYAREYYLMKRDSDVVFMVPEK